MSATLLRTDAPLTGRQVHALVSDDYSLWTVQEALKALTQLGLVNTQTIGRAGVHTVNEDHVAVAPLRTLLDPVAALTDTVREAIGDDVDTVILFGSIARGEAHIKSDIDLAVIAPAGWRGAPIWRTRFVPGSATNATFWSSLPRTSPACQGSMNLSFRKSLPRASR